MKPTERTDEIKSNSINDGLTARPTKGPEKQTETSYDYGSPSLGAAKAAGYTDEKGEAVDKAKPDVEGNPTGAYTDIGAGRSGVVKPSKH
jgi:hypothetical protein